MLRSVGDRLRNRRARTSWPSEGYEAITERVGRASYTLLLSEASWVHRRIETISVLSHELAHRSVSIDFTVPAPVRPWLQLPGGSESLVPVATLRKHPLRDFDLRDESGAAVPLLEKSQNGPIAHQVLLTAARLALSGADIDAVSDELSDHLFKVAHGDGDEADQAVAEMLHAAEAERDDYQAFLSNDRSRFLLGLLDENFLMVAQLTEVQRRRIVKYAFDHELEPQERPTLWERLGWQAFTVDTLVPAASHAQSYHAEVDIPEELRFDGSAIIDEITNELTSERTLIPYAVDGETDRAALYASGVPLGANPVLFLALRAERAGFPVIAAAVAWITTIILGAGAVTRDLSSLNAGPAVSVLLAGSALFAGAVATTGEHRLVQSLFSLPRTLLALSAVSALVAGAALAFQLGCVRTLWDACAVLALTVAGILTVTLVRGAKSTP